MEEKRDVPRTLALVLIILTVIISATSTWVLITETMDSGPETGINKAILRLNIFRGQPAEQPQADTNSGDVKLYIAKGG